MLVKIVALLLVHANEFFGRNTATEHAWVFGWVLHLLVLAGTVVFVGVSFLLMLLTDGRQEPAAPWLGRVGVVFAVILFYGWDVLLSGILDLPLLGP